MNTKYSMAASWAGLVGITLVAGWLGAAATTPEIGGWYATIHKPTWNPPNWIFGPVWTTLYIMMATAAWLVWRASGKRSRVALGLYAAQLALNTLWSFLFFRFHRPDLAFVELLILWGAIVATTISFARHSKFAAALMLPYLAWVTFAAVLNFSIWRMNL